MERLSDRIRFIRKKTGNTQETLAQLLGCSDGKVKGWEQDNTLIIKHKDSLKIAETYGFNQDWIEDGVGEPMTSQDDLLLKNISTTNAMLSKTVSIPFYKDISASSGYGCTNADCEKSHINIPQSMLHVVSDGIEAIKVSGNSMADTIHDEDIIFLDKNDTYPIDLKVYVIFLCEEVYVKRIFIEPKEKSIILKSDNPLFPQIDADCEDFRILGRVIANMNISKL